MEIIRPTEAHSPTGDRREGQVRTQKESDRPRTTHQLETAQGGTSQDTERIRPTEAHSLPGDRTGRDKSEHGKHPTDRGPLTNWRPHGEGQIRTQKESDRRGPLTSWRPHMEGQSQDTERFRQTEAHSLPGDRTRRDKSGHGKNPTD